MTTFEECQRAYDNQEHPDYYGGLDVCPECGEESVDGVKSGKWCEWWCINPECDYGGDNF